jgi:hypothetical protein
MKREYSTGTHDIDPDFFVGSEVEHTSAYGMKTLFCHGDLSTSCIVAKIAELKKADRINFPKHIYLNHNHSFCASRDNKIDTLLALNYFVTYEAQDFEDIVPREHDRLIHLLSIKIPNATKKNLSIKIDDVDFDYSNPGVWTFHASQLNDYFTPWSAYQGDEIL